MTSKRGDDAFIRFRRNWLAFDETRPTRPRLALRFVVVVTACLIITAALAFVARGYTF